MSSSPCGRPARIRWSRVRLAADAVFGAILILAFVVNIAISIVVAAACWPICRLLWLAEAWRERGDVREGRS